MNGCDDQPLLVFPCHYEFKAFGPAADAFIDRVQAAVSSVVPTARDAMRSRLSSAGSYQCVSVMVSLPGQAQLEAIYAALREIDDLKYLL